MKKLFIYYSLTGNGEAVALKMEELGFETIRVKPKRDISGPFFFKIMRGGFQALRKASPKLDGSSDLTRLDPPASEYDVIAVGSPVWFARLSPAANSVLKTRPEKAGQLSFVLWAGGGEAPKALERIKKEYPGAPVIIMKQPSENPSELEKLGEYLTEQDHA